MSFDPPPTSARDQPNREVLYPEVWEVMRDALGERKIQEHPDIVQYAEDFDRPEASGLSRKIQYLMGQGVRSRPLAGGATWTFPFDLGDGMFGRFDQDGFGRSCGQQRVCAELERDEFVHGYVFLNG